MMVMCVSVNLHVHQGAEWPYVCTQVGLLFSGVWKGLMARTFRLCNNILT